MSDIQRTNYDVVLAVAIKDAERDVIEAAEYEYDTSEYITAQLAEAVRTLRRVREGGEP